MIIKCKMCGGDIEFIPGATYGTCEYCGSTSTIPKADDEQKLNRYNRANHFRRQCEFDKALAAYEKILEQDDTDAEAHWGAVLSRFGIEYVEDPASKKRIPTCHRVQVASILADADYLAAAKYAPDAESRRLYEEQAAQIAEIQKDILAISANEKPYDVFICYKETDDNGQRTRDSQWAQDVYYGLTDAGYKVFFSRITLEDKLGQQYEPYIFAALNSAKVMVVIGSKPEYFNAVWVKNEWSRYLALMASDRKRLLIPCYRDMDPYDLPEELSNLQSQDMSKIGFMQDLLRGVKKVLEADKTEESVHVVQQVVQTSGEAVAPGVSSLIERAYLFMEDGDFQSTIEYLERVLDIDPKYAPAYAAKVCVELGLRSEKELGELNYLYEDHADWQKTLRFATPEQRQTYEGYIQQVKSRIQQTVDTYTVECAIEAAVRFDADILSLKRELEQFKASCMSHAADHTLPEHRAGYARNAAAFQKASDDGEPANTEQAYRAAAEIAASVSDGEKAQLISSQCLALAALAHQKALYQSAIARNGNALELKRCASILDSIPDYRDARAKAEQYRAQAEEAIRQQYQQAKAKMQSAGTDSQKWDDAKQLLSKAELNGYLDVDELRKQTEQAYHQAVESERQAEKQKQELLARQQAAKVARTKRTFAVMLVAALLITAGAMLAFKVIIPDQKYRRAEELLGNGQYQAASEAFAALEDYSDAAERVKEPYYVQAEALLAEGKIDEASAMFASLGDYRDAVERRWQPYAQQANALLEAGDYDGAAGAYLSLYNQSGYTYAEAATMANECYYRKANALESAGQTGDALAVYERIPGYQDSMQKARAIYMARGMEALKAMRLAEAREAFTACGDLQTAQEQLQLLDAYEAAAAQQSQGDYIAARAGYLSVGEYLDAPAQAEACGAAQYATAYSCLQSGQIASAYTLFTGLGDYSDSAAQAEAISNAYAAAEELLSAGSYDEAVEAFGALCDYQDSAVKVQEAQYQKAKALADSGAYDEAIALYDSLGSYRSSRDNAQTARYAKAEALAASGDKMAAEAVYAAIPEYGDVAQKLIALRTELGSDALERKDYAAALAYYLNVPQSEEVRALEYRLAQTCYDDGCYEYATKAYEVLGQYELSVSKLPVARYAWADQLFAKGQYAQAAEQFALLNGSTDSAERARESTYQYGRQQMEQGLWDEAKAIFGGIADYQDAGTQIKECDYRKASQLMDGESYADAKALFETLKTYSDSQTLAKECGYQLAEADLALGHYAEAQQQYEALNGYSDSADKVELCIYERAQAYAASGNYADAETLYASISGYKDSADRVRLCRYEQGNARFAAQDYAGALAFYTDLGYRDSETLVAQCHCAMGRQYLSIGNVEEAVREYVQALALSEAREALYDIGKDYATVNQMEKAIETLWACGDYEPSLALLAEISGLLEQSGNTVNAAIARYAIWSNNASADIVLPDGTVDIAQSLTTYGILPNRQFANAIWYTMGETRREVGDWEGAVTAFEKAGEYSDAAKQIMETHYQHAQSLMKAGDYNQAYALFKTLKGYADVDSLLANDENLLAAAAAREAMFSVGNYVTFGTYPQTKAGNDETPIEWLVLARDGDNALLLSRYGLDAQPYNENWVDITWEKCTLRTWLNKDFINRAFTAAEQSAILLTNVDNSNSQGYSRWNTSGGNNTQDKVFLLSYAEANKYLGVTYDNSSNTESRVAPTAYAIAQGAYTSDSNKTADGQAAGWWWLRSPGRYRNRAAYVHTYGSLHYYGVNDARGSVRPALWVNLESGIF